MKNLMIAITAVVSAFGLYADNLKTGTSFEALTVGAFDKTKDDAGQSNPPWWFSTEVKPEGVITEYASGEAYTGDRPKMFEGDPQANYLELMTAEPLYRGATTLTQGATEIDAAFSPQTIGSGFYIDQLVKFTASDDGDADIDLEGGKIAVWLKEANVNGVPEVNLMVTAGYFNKPTTTVRKDYAVTLGGSKSAADLIGSWHRVTIKAIEATDRVVGFIVYIDGEAVTTTEAIAVDGVAYKTLAQKYVDEKSLFPSAVCEGGYAKTITAVGFLGAGAIDDVSLTTIAPSFAEDPITFTLDWDPTKFTTITAGDQVLNVADGATNLTLAADTTSLTIDATPVAGYTASLQSTDCDVDGMTFFFNAASSGSIIATENLFEVDGKGYPTFAEALAAAAEAGPDATITLKGACTIDALGEGYETPVVENDVTLDLAGNDLYINDDTNICELYADFTLINSGKDARIGIDAETHDAQLFTGGSLIVGTPANQSGFIFFDATVIDGEDPIVYQAKISKEYNGDPGLFDVPEGYELDETSDPDYWIVRKKGGTTVIVPGQTIGLGGGSMTPEEAQAAAAKIPIVLTDDDEEAGLTTDSLIVKPVFVSGAWLAEVDVKPELVPEVEVGASKPIEVTAGNFKAEVKDPVPGLYYGFVSVDSLEGDVKFAPIVKSFVRAKAGENLTLTAQKSGDACFYKLSVRVRPPTDE